MVAFASSLGLLAARKVRCGPLRGLVDCVLRTQGSRIRPRLHAVARSRAGSLRVAYPGLEDSPWATRCRPLTGWFIARCVPRARGLALGYTVSPAHGLVHCALRTQGSRTRPGLHGVARSRAGSLRVAYPGLEES